MLRRLFGLFLLSTLCSSMYRGSGTNIGSLDRSTNGSDNTMLFTGLGFTSSGGMNRAGPVELGMSSLPMDLSESNTDNVMFPDPLMCDVLLSSAGPYDQIPLFCLCSYCKGKTGQKGPRGDVGPSGFEGSTGRRGLTGWKGTLGFTGAPGVKGQTGEIGEKGLPGPIGTTGVKGDRGFKGEKGDDGDEGFAGPLGPQGLPGSCQCEIVVGPPGKPGAPGQSGARGIPGTAGSKGFPGVGGDKGDKGLDGPGGLAGLKGKVGLPGPCDCIDRVDGTDGPKGLAGEKGVKGVVGVPGDQGDMGPKGLEGDMGFSGMPGPCTMAFQSSFTAVLETSFPAPGRPVRFTSIIYNPHSHYSPNIGIFIVPVNGTYVFTANLLVKERKLIAGLYLNFEPVAKVTEYTDTTTVSLEVVLHLKVRDQVWVQVKDTDNNGMYAGKELSSSFSGWLLSPDSCIAGDIRDAITPPDITVIPRLWRQQSEQRWLDFSNHAHFLLDGAWLDLSGAPSWRDGTWSPVRVSSPLLRL